MPENPGRFVELDGGVPMSAGFGRALAARAWGGRCEIPVVMLQRAGELASQVPALPGRVHSMGSFSDEAAAGALRGCLPPPLAAALRPHFEWYGCRGAGFHTDAHYDAVLFGAWCVAGPDRRIVLGRSGRSVPGGAGSVLVFDPFEPHAVLDEGRAGYERDRYEGAPASLFVAFELELTPAVRENFGIGPPALGARVISSATAVNAETGAIG